MSPVVIGVLVAFVAIISYCTWKAPRLTSVIFWSFIASMLFSAALLLTLPIEFKSLALWMALGVSIIWVAFQFWCYWDKSGWRVAAAMITITVVSGAIVFTTPAPV